MARRKRRTLRAAKQDHRPIADGLLKTDHKMNADDLRTEDNLRTVVDPLNSNDRWRLAHRLKLSGRSVDAEQNRHNPRDRNHRNVRR